ncbi:Fe-S cluster assembly ATPase SufC [Candidatus Woesearchaeota archaeon]|nr:Fe-S cluster assembly ATPase SufC [Candidatus Woesearchaeota archaeon]
MTDKLVVEDLHVSVEGKMILKGITLELSKGEVIAIMGPNGSGKSTLANTLMGHPKYKIEKGRILLNGEDITNLPAHERSLKGLFLSFQYPVEIAGVTMTNFLRTAVNARRKEPVSVIDFHKLIKEKMKLLSMNEQFRKRSINEGFSGGEKKRAEILQMLVLEPTFAILDETDSGLDVDALKVVAEGINTFKGAERGIMLITHYHRILNYVRPNKVFVMSEGRIIRSGGADLAYEIEKNGFEDVQKTKSRMNKV